MKTIIKREEFLILLGQARENERGVLRQQVAAERRRRFRARLNVAKSLFSSAKDGEPQDEYARRRAG